MECWDRAAYLFLRSNESARVEVVRVVQCEVENRAGTIPDSVPDSMAVHSVLGGLFHATHGHDGISAVRLDTSPPS